MSDATGGSSMTRSSNPSHDGGFDLSNEGSVLALLRAIHMSSLELETKNELRDTVFAFRAEAGAIVTAELAAMFSEHGFDLRGVAEPAEVATEMQTDQKLVQKPKSRFGMSRTRPQFAAVTTPAVQTPTPTPEVEASQPVVPTLEEKQGSEPATVKVEVATPVVPEAEIKPAPVTPVPEVEVEPAPLPVPKVEEVKVAEPVEAPPVAVEDTQAAEPADVVAPAAASIDDRIKEIKHEVNEMVGNPVNLIDVHNEVGREYMNALLDAMKKSAGGSGGQDAAMQRLEAAFAAVQETLNVHTRNKADAPPVEKKESTVPKEPVQESKKVAEAPLPSKSDFAPAPISEEAFVKKNAQEKKKEAVVEAPVEAVEPEGQGGSLSSVAKDKQVQEMMVAQKREHATTDQQRKEAEIASMDPLMTPEVTAGLGQLLSEWSIFKHSGLFGTGPSGADHPLYKKLMVVPMAAVVAGRFEGVTPQIKRSITDYMNGWRYEEGIMHEQGEAFEHYLRRVIKHILKKRSGKSS